MLLKLLAIILSALIILAIPCLAAEKNNWTRSPSFLKQPYSTLLVVPKLCFGELLSVTLTLSDQGRELPPCAFSIPVWEFPAWFPNLTCNFHWVFRLSSLYILTHLFCYFMVFNKGEKHYRKKNHSFYFVFCFVNWSVKLP